MEHKVASMDIFQRSYDYKGYTGMIDLMNNTSYEMMIDDDFAFGLVKQAFEDNGPDTISVYEFEAPIYVQFTIKGDTTHIIR